ncbi:TPA: hypothetical protein KRE72_003382 [Clostridioides difficile]|uniref:DUF2971 domain-containing protein n=1 Tax=Clostridioides difficile TaxID=1496 RepID=A0AB74QGQ3_CLODI|nr:hypothetical protein [Clostridioides difficile]MBY2049352.1 hypothetical protein [Clostridioides difficile]MCF2715180.1 hypothetical protein [Clostridioides difficile]MDI3042284.1 hypothetical protein [Clostridioides difficile]MDX5660988.1 hypothetical protein [Clostridioides difficile]VFD35802.1 Uncharacterised protein [Clostridioides difficile]
MSCIQIIGFKRNGIAECYDTVENPFLGALSVWRILSKKYMRREINFLNDNDVDELFNLYKDKRLSREDRIVLGSTFDEALIKKENLKEVIEIYRNFKGKTNLREQADILKRILDNDEYIAVGFNQTSVNCDSWISYSYEYNDNDDDEYEKIENNYNCLEGDKHFWLIQDIDNMKLENSIFRKVKNKIKNYIHVEKYYR